MKRFQLIATALLLPLLGHGQAFVDDIYYSPGDENAQAETPKAEPANYKNGAKEIVFIDSNSGEELYLDTDTIFLDNSLTEYEAAEADAPLAETDVQVAEAAEEEPLPDGEYTTRIKRFHRPGTIIITDADYVDVAYDDDGGTDVYINMYGDYDPFWWDYPSSWWYWGRPYYAGYWGWYDPWYWNWGWTWGCFAYSNEYII